MSKTIDRGRCRVRLLVLGVLVAGVHMAVAEDVLMVQLTYLSLGRGYEGGVLGAKASTSSVTSSWGGTLTGYSGRELGLLTSVGVYAPTHVSVRQSSGDQSFSGDQEVEDGGIATTADLGVGWNIAAAPSFRVLLGGGLHVNLLALFPPEESEDEDVDVSSVMGVGVQVLPVYSVSDVFNINAALSASYSFLEFGVPEVEGASYTGALNWSVSLGAGFSW